VFKCEFVAENVCRKAVDEGFLQKNWFPHNEIDSLQYRGYTWGDKKGLIKQNLIASEEPVLGAAPGEETEHLDACGCKSCAGEGFSTGRGSCARGSMTQVFEALQCTAGKAHNGKDSCGCDLGRGEGWSSTRRVCRQGSGTDPREACACRQQPAMIQEN